MLEHKQDRTAARKMRLGSRHLPAVGGFCGIASRVLGFKLMCGCVFPLLWPDALVMNPKLSMAVNPTKEAAHSGVVASNQVEDRTRRVKVNWQGPIAIIRCGQGSDPGSKVGHKGPSRSFRPCRLCLTRISTELPNQSYFVPTQTSGGSNFEDTTVKCGHCLGPFCHGRFEGRRESLDQTL